MFDFSWSEVALIGAVALIAIGPKDLPKALRTAGTWARKARTISREFQSSIEQMIREAELDEVKKEVEKVTAVDLEHEVKQAIDPGGSIAESLKPPEMPDVQTIARDPPAPPLLPASPEGGTSAVTAPPAEPSPPAPPAPSAAPATTADEHAPTPASPTGHAS
jgi:sec-independent protein translocase protein TatB